jgi:hypothetical protein
LNQATSFTLDPLAPSGLAVNPGCEATFPWLSQVANNFEQYKFHFLRFIFKSTNADSVNSAATTNNLGIMIYQMTYDVYDAVPSSRLEMTNYYGTKRARPCDDFALDVNVVKPDLMYVRSGSATSTVQGDKRLYDIGTFFIASDGAASAGQCGELWVEYSVMFYKPKLFDTLGYNVTGAAVQRSGATSALWLGTGALVNTHTSTGNTLGLTFANVLGVDDGLSLRFPPTNNARCYLVTFSWSTAGAGTAFATNGNALNNFTNVISPVQGFTTALAGQTAATLSFVVKIITPGVAAFIFFIAGGTALTAPSTVTIRASEVDYNLYGT